MKEPLSIVQIQRIISDITFRDWEFLITEKGDGFLIQISYRTVDVDTGEMALQKGRKWYVSSWAIESEIVQTCLKAVITVMEHEAREHFLYKGVRAFGPHFDINALVELARWGKTATRKDEGM
jgi:hypothetical protein